MRLVGPCHICGAPAMHSCSLCGRLVCRGCFEVLTGSCAVCRKKKEGKEKDKPDDKFVKRF